MDIIKKTGLLLLILWAADGTVEAADGDCSSTMAQHHVILTTPKDDLGHCSGSLIQPKWVLSAAQCDRKDLEVILGRTKDKNGERRNIKEKVIFKDSKKQQHDLMLLEVELQTTDKFPFVSLSNKDSCSSPAENSAVQYTAWAGETINFEDNTITPQTLKCGSTSVVACGDKSRYGDDPDEEVKAYFYQKLLCVSHPTDACDLLAGGALQQAGILHGVLVISDLYCKAALEFVSVCHKDYREWIHKTTGQ